jgi:hypothetical protein
LFPDDPQNIPLRSSIRELDLLPTNRISRCSPRETI